jgi:hypothetical protein
MTTDPGGHGPQESDSYGIVARPEPPPERRSRNPARRAFQNRAEGWIEGTEKQATLPAHVRMESEDAVVAAPMSFAGSAQHVRNVMTRVHGRTAVRVLLITALVLVLIVWWALIVCWYLTFGLLLVPYRLIRRGQRKRDLEMLRHREIMSAMEDRRGPGTP